MKECLFFLSLLLVLASCNSHQSLYDDVSGERLLNSSRYRTVEDAISIAEKVLANDKVGARSSSRLIGHSGTHVILCTQSRSNDIDTLLYALDVENDGGFVLVAAPINVEPIMAVIESGNYLDSSAQNNEAYNHTIDLIKQYVAVQAIGGGFVDPIPVLPPIFKVLEYYDTIKINRVHEPTVEVAWNQGWPENNFAPNDYAGCVPVAIAQTLATMEKPNKITYTFPERDINSENYDWKEIKKHKRSSFSGRCTECSATESVHLSIARFLREIGHQINADYRWDGTYAFTDQSKNIIYKYAGINPDKEGNSLWSLYHNIDDAAGLAILRYDLINDPITAGHAFIADGSKNIEYSIIRHYLEDPTSTEYKTEYIKNEKTKLIHYNWGWGSNCNGWFNLDAVQPANAVEYDYRYQFNYSSHEFDKNTIDYWYYKL